MCAQPLNPRPCSSTLRSRGSLASPRAPFSPPPGAQRSNATSPVRAPVNCTHEPDTKEARSHHPCSIPFVRAWFGGLLIPVSFQTRRRAGGRHRLREEQDQHTPQAEKQRSPVFHVEHEQQSAQGLENEGSPPTAVGKRKPPVAAAILPLPTPPIHPPNDHIRSKQLLGLTT